MKLALVGTGRMGAAVERMAGARGHTVAARFDGARPLDPAATPEVFGGADVAIDFSLPSLVDGHVRAYCAAGLSAVVGTTGWDAVRDDVRARVLRHGIGLLAAPNFSLGVALLREALRRLAPILDRLPDFDVYISETHHTGKVDSPSGTALLLAETLLDGLARKRRLLSETAHGPIPPDALHVTSTRAGSVVGTHTVGIEGPYDALTLTHTARSRDGFALGALTAAEWLPGRTGFFTLEDMVRDLMSEVRGQETSDHRP